MASCTFTMFFNHHQYLVLRDCIPSNRNLYLLTNHSPIPCSHPLATSNQLSVPIDLPILKISCKWNHIICDFHVWHLFYLACFKGSSMLQHVLILHSFLWMNNIQSYRYTLFFLFMHYLLNIWLVSTCGCYK